MMGLPDGRESFKIGLAVLIQYWRVTDTLRSIIPRLLRRAGKTSKSGTEQDPDPAGAQ